MNISKMSVNFQIDLSDNESSHSDDDQLEAIYEGAEGLFHKKCFPILYEPYRLYHIGLYIWVYNFPIGFQRSETNDGIEVKYYPSETVTGSWNSKYTVLNRICTQITCYV